jgi:uncharacterized protein (DUF697 family)
LLDRPVNVRISIWCVPAGASVDASRYLCDDVRRDDATAGSRKDASMEHWLTDLRSRIQRGLPEVWDAVMAPGGPPVSDQALIESARSRAVVVWLVGKVQSGKTSIVKTLTGASEAEIGSGFRACTTAARIFDFPADAPLIRFLDTRGIEEAGYDPAEDIAVAESQAHVALVVMRALDPDQSAVIRVVTEARRRHPGWPVIVAQTTLHHGYAPGAGHILPYPFTGDGVSTSVPVDLQRSLAHQRKLFERLQGSGAVLFVPLDFTDPGDGLTPPDYGLDALIAALAVAAPAGLAGLLGEARARGNDTLAAKAHPHIVGYAAAAGAVDILPVAGLVAVPAVQAKMLHALAHVYAVDWDRKVLAEFAACLGAGVMARVAASLGLRQVAKLIPVYGQTAGAAAAAAASFATTYALGKAAVYFLAQRRTGESNAEGVARTYREALAAALDMRQREGTKSGA